MEILRRFCCCCCSSSARHMISLASKKTLNLLSSCLSAMAILIAIIAQSAYRFQYVAATRRELAAPAQRITVCMVTTMTDSASPQLSMVLATHRPQLQCQQQVVLRCTQNPKASAGPNLKCMSCCEPRLTCRGCGLTQQVVCADQCNRSFASPSSLLIVGQTASQDLGTQSTVTAAG